MYNTIHTSTCRHWKDQFPNRKKGQIKAIYNKNNTTRVGVRSVPHVTWYGDESWRKWGLKGCLCSDFMLMVNTAAFLRDLAGERNPLNVCGSLSGKRVPEHAVKLTRQREDSRKRGCYTSFLFSMKWITLGGFFSPPILINLVCVYMKLYGIVICPVLFMHDNKLLYVLGEVNERVIPAQFPEMSRRCRLSSQQVHISTKNFNFLPTLGGEKRRNNWIP